MCEEKGTVSNKKMRGFGGDDGDRISSKPSASSTASPPHPPIPLQELNITNQESLAGFR
jgi:hypothetical protein